MISKYFIWIPGDKKISLSHCTLGAPHSYMAEIIWASSLRWVLGHHMHGLLCLLYIHVTWKPCVGVHYGRALLFTVVVALISHRGQSNVNNTMHALYERASKSPHLLFLYKPILLFPFLSFTTGLVLMFMMFFPVGVRPSLFSLALDGRRSKTRAPIQTHIYPV
jgi:hypothetical protein